MCRSHKDLSDGETEDAVPIWVIDENELETTQATRQKFTSCLTDLTILVSLLLLKPNFTILFESKVITS
jgi:hypothetical protein